MVTLVMPGNKPVTLREYRYFATDRPVDDHGFPVVSAVRKDVDLASGLKVNLPMAGVVFLTTHAPEDLSVPGK